MSQQAGVQAASAIDLGNCESLLVSATDVWIFQAVTSVSTSTATSIVLTGGALAENVFWQVGTTLSTGTSSAFVGTVLAGTSITLGSSSSLLGRSLAQASVFATSGNTITSFDTVSIPSNFQHRKR